MVLSIDVRDARRCERVSGRIGASRASSCRDTVHQNIDWRRQRRQTMLIVVGANVQKDMQFNSNVSSGDGDEGGTAMMWQGRCAQWPYLEELY